jgi:protease-4
LKNSGQKQIGYRLNLEDIQYDYAGKYMIHLSQFSDLSGLMEVIQAIEEAKTDNDIEGIYIK